MAIIVVANAFLCAIVTINIVATVRVPRDDLSSRMQRAGQIAFIWLIPILGTTLTIYLMRNDLPRGAGTYPKEPANIEDIVFISGPGVTHSENEDLDHG
ncbi:hypothetical protein SAMN04515617_10529 [Collimonas sp. OK242]|uniref:hypothetical protein n=1 Tax=Collimonas sp. OK242 TaxID=1798195 RepID=UPI000898C965|nr:hypothetical protein [Collimonas sp. OK242]SDX58897.1 hypothetical protein SAMN04515617_10529 [Collimonas sp. OK242]